MPNQATPKPPVSLAAVDLGSNSFHLVVAEYTHGQLQLRKKIRQRTVMASGLDEQLQLDTTAMARGLQCLADFAALLNEEQPSLVRALGTNTLRVARNSKAFTDQAENVLGHPVETICGSEEARLIYLGASQAMANPEQCHLVVDIGGGSTELIVGAAGKPQLLHSLPLGCVVYRHRFFADDAITEQQFSHAYTAALAELLPLREAYLRLNWQTVVGTSGTAHTAVSVLHAMGLCPEREINKPGLLALRAHLLTLGNLQAIALPGLEPERASILPAGVAILLALFDAFSITSMHYAEGALREGILYDLLQRGTSADVRHQSVAQMRKQYALPQQRSEQVTATAAQFFSQVAKAWELNQEHLLFLTWAASLHELGRTISHNQHHRHGAYVLENSDLAGFSMQEQRLLAFLIGAQKEHPKLAPLPQSQQRPFLQLAVLLRLANLLQTP